MINFHDKLTKKWAKARDAYLRGEEHKMHPTLATVDVVTTEFISLIDSRSGNRVFNGGGSDADAHKDLVASLEATFAEYPYAYPITDKERVDLLTKDQPFLASLGRGAIVLTCDLKGFVTKDHLMFADAADAQKAIDAGLVKSMTA